MSADLAWLAGLWDGEGSIGVSAGRPAVQLSMTHLPTVEFAAKILTSHGVASLGYSYQEKKPDRQKDAYHLRVNRMDDQLKMARLLLPFAVTKSRNWELLIEYISGRPHQHGGIRRGGDFKARQFTERDRAIWAEFSSLNRRGPVAPSVGVATKPLESTEDGGVHVRQDAGVNPDARVR